MGDWRGYPRLHCKISLKTILVTLVMCQLFLVNRSGDSHGHFVLILKRLLDALVK